MISFDMYGSRRIVCIWKTGRTIVSSESKNRVVGFQDFQDIFNSTRRVLMIVTDNIAV